MPWQFGIRTALQCKASKIYGAIVAQARHRNFYAKLGIPDTPTGRYEMVVLHLFLALERLRMEGARAGTLARLLIESFVRDMDDSLRELGAGDMAVARKVRRAAAGLYERSRDYRAALAAADLGELERLLARHPLAPDAEGWLASALAGYVRKAAASLSEQEAAAFLDGQLAFPAVPAGAEDLQ